MGKQEPGRGPSPGSKRKELGAIRQARNCPKTVPLKVKRMIRKGLTNLNQEGKGGRREGSAVDNYAWVFELFQT